MKKKYKGESLVINSRFKDYYKMLNRRLQKNIVKRTDKLIQENVEYCDKGNYKHLSNIFTSIAIYENLQIQHSREESFKILSHEMWTSVEKNSKMFKKISRIPFILKIMGILLPYLFNKGSGYGWKYKWHNDISDNNQLKFECTQCIYQQIFKKYHMKELGPMFCHADDINYGHLDNITFIRRHTLCKDGKNCDFLFTRKQSKEAKH